MFGKILGKTKDEPGDDNGENKELIEKISKMNLTDMKAYIGNRVPNFEVNEDGLSEIMRKLLKKNEKTSKRYVEIDDMDSKIKKAFELVLLIGKNKKITTLTITFILDFMKIYMDIIRQYDTENKEIYASRFVKIIDSSIQKIDGVTQEESKMMLMNY